MSPSYEDLAASGMQVTSASEELEQIEALARALAAALEMANVMLRDDGRWTQADDNDALLDRAREHGLLEGESK